MNRDSDIETELADDDWLAASAGSTPERNTQDQNQDGGLLNNVSDGAFDEEELFSPTGSLSSLDEFSDSDTDGSSVSIYSTGTSHSGSGPIVRNGATPIRKNRDGQLEPGFSAGNTESEIEVVYDEAKSDGLPKSMRNPSSTIRGSSPSAWLVQRGRKVIADDDDDDEGDGDNEGEVEAGSIKPSKSKATNKEKRVQKHSLDEGDGRSPARKLKHISAKDQDDATRRKRRAGKRRKARYDNPDYVDESGYPQLIYFASKGDTVTCRRLLASGAAIDIADSHGWTALHEASKRSHLETLELLLNPPIRIRPGHEQNRGAGDADSTDVADSKIWQQLHSPFPNVNATATHSRMTPLHQAVATDDIRIVRMLLDNGALTNVTNSRQLTPLDICSNEKIARLLTDRAKIQRSLSVRDKAGQTKLHRACSAGDLDQAISLINQGAEINMKDNAGWTPLHEASLEGHNSVVVALLRHGADYTVQGFGGDTPLHDACANGHVDVVCSLLAAGADPLLKNYKNVTPEDMAEDEEDVLQVIARYKRTHIKPVKPVKPSITNGSKDKGEAHEPRPSSRAGEARNEDTESVVDIEERGSGNDGELPAKPKIRPEKRDVRHSLAQPRSSDAQSKRELQSLKRLREEAEKPQVNYYFSSSTSKLSRDERKLQVVMGTFERMEKRKSKGKCRQSAEPESENSHSRGEVADSHQPRNEPHRSSIINKQKHRDDDSEKHVYTQEPSTSLSPKRRRGRPPKKRVIDDDDDENGNGAGTSNSSHQASVSKEGRVVPSAKRARQSIDAEVSAAADEGSSRIIRSSYGNLFETVTTLTPTVEIKCEAASLSDLHSYPGITIHENVASTTKSSSRQHSGATNKDKPSKHRGLEGGCTIVEDGSARRIPQSENLSPSSIAARAIRYLPLYTIQLHSDPPTSKLDYFVVDMQIRLLLGMPISTRSSSPSAYHTSSKDTDSEKNPLFIAYPHLYRQKIKDSQKEHLWEPLAGMFVSNMHIIRETAAATGTYTSKPSEPTANADDEIVDQFTLHEKKKFVALSLYFVKLDEIVELIKRDYPRVSKQLITITLDISSIGLADSASAAMPVTKARPISSLASSESRETCPVWKGPQKMVPLRYALKMHYRNRMEFMRSHNQGGGK